MASLTLIAASPASAAGAPPAADPEKAKPIVETVCVACHSIDGTSVVPMYPNLAGQGRAYIYRQLTNFKPADEKTPAARVNAVMEGMVATLSDEDMHNLAAYFSQQKPVQAPPNEEKKALIPEGQKLWRMGDFAKGIPACAGCHGPRGAGLPAQYPHVAGQHQEYTTTQLKTFRSGERANDPEGMMRAIADKLSDRQIDALSEYMANLH
ncbi:MAG: cytochrome c4 [Betaproteobacteria bacterium]|nr:cytochrome c4 [Betaproteobacteria bacterium]